MKKDKVKSFKEWYDEEGEEFAGKPKNHEWKKKSLRKETALRRLDVDAFLDEEDEDY